MKSLKDATVWITGCSSGVGYATAVLLAKQGAHVIAIARRQEKLSALREMVAADTTILGKITPLALDITHENEIASKAKPIIDAEGVDVLINNAGIMLTSEVDEFARDDWRKMIELNCMGTLNMVDLLYPTMIKQQAGHIINIGSLRSIRTVPGNAVYSMTKYGLRGFTDALRKEAIAHGIRVGEILPGGINTELRNHITSERILARINKGEVGNIKQRLEAEDIANSILFLLQQPKHVNIGSLVIRPFETLD